MFFLYGQYFTEKTSYTDDNLNSPHVNVTDPTKDSFNQPLGIQEILDELEISKDYY